MENSSKRKSAENVLRKYGHGSKRLLVKIRIFGVVFRPLSLLTVRARRGPVDRKINDHGWQHLDAGRSKASSRVWPDGGGVRL